MEKFRCLGVTVTNTNDIREEIKRLLSKKFKINIYKTIILPVLLYCLGNLVTHRERGEQVKSVQEQSN